MVVIIPAYQPDEKLTGVVHALLEQTDFPIVVVNDGSRESCQPVFEALRQLERVTVLTHEVNRGKGAAMKTAFLYVYENMPEQDGVVTVDADGQHLPVDVKRVAEAFAAAPESMVMGGRRFTGNVPLRSRVGNTITRFVFAVSTGVKVYDTQTGLRAFAVKRVPEMLQLQGDRYEFEISQLLYCTKKEIPIVEVPIETVYIEDNASSHFNSIRDGWRIYKMILAFVSSSILSFLFEFLLTLGLRKMLTGAVVASWGLGAGLMAVVTSITFRTLIARILSSILNFQLNKRVAFESNAKNAFGKYALTAVGIYLLYLMLMWFFEHLLHLPEWLAIILSQFISYPLSFYVQRKFVFKESGKGKK